jgi:hypothetical protein
MAQLSSYKTSAFIYDLYCKCSTNQKFSLVNLAKYHSLGSAFLDAVKEADIIVKVNARYKWIGVSPDTFLIEKIEKLRIEKVKSFNERYRGKGLSLEDIKPFEKEIQAFINTLKSK